MSYFENGGEAEEEGRRDKELRLKREKKQREEDAGKLAPKRAKELQIPLQQAYQQILQEMNQKAQQDSNATTSASTGVSTGVQRSQSQANTQNQQQMPQISQQQQAMTAQASQAAFDPKNSGDVNKQLAIFGQVLTGVNQTLVQYGTVIQNLVAAQGQLIQGGGGGQGQGENGGVSNGNGISEYTQRIGEFVQTLQQINIPEQITLSGKHEVNVNVAGGEALSQALEGSLGKFVLQRVRDGLNRWVDQELPPETESIPEL